MPCSRHYHSQYLYSAFAYAVSADFDRPKKQNLIPQASVVLPGHGGHGTHRIPGQKVDGLVSFKEAYSEVGGSYDDCHGTHTTHSWSVLEDVNVADMLTADRVVARIAVYYKDGESRDLASYDITGSYFENLRIAGHRVDVKLDTLAFHQNDTFKKIADGHKDKTNDNLLLGAGLLGMKKEEFEALQDKYTALIGMSEVLDQWRQDPRPERHTYMLSAANGLTLEGQNKTELECYGSFICIPKFGVIRLGEVVVHRHSRTLRMFRVQMCSSGHGTSDGPTTTGGTGGG